ncbi:hypothetical protein U1Q18_019904 [Sarracenia purpurea var. burkii]
MVVAVSNTSFLFHRVVQPVELIFMAVATFFDKGVAAVLYSCSKYANIQLDEVGLVALAALNPWFSVVFNRVMFAAVALSAMDIGVVLSVLHLGLEHLVLGVAIFGSPIVAIVASAVEFGASATSSPD